MSVTEVMVNEKVHQKLGEEGLRDLTACLWAVDCQTCGGFLGNDPPVLCVDDMMVYAVATIHHQRCRIPNWNDSGAIQGVSADHLSLITRMVLLPANTSCICSRAVSLDLMNPTMTSRQAECCHDAAAAGRTWPAAALAASLTSAG